MSFRFADLLIFIRIFTRFTFFGNTRLYSPQPGIWGRVEFPHSLAKFASTASSKLIGFIIVPLIVSKVCAETDASYNSPGLEIREIRINFLNSERKANCSSSVNGSPICFALIGKISISWISPPYLLELKAATGEVRAPWRIFSSTVNSFATFLIPAP